MKKIIPVIVILTAVGGGIASVYVRRTPAAPDVRTARVSRGDIVDAVQATGTVQAVTTVEVGTQVGGIVQELYADYNSIVRKGQVLARLDATLLDTQIEQQRANVVRSEADLERLQVTLADATQKRDRARALTEKNLVPKTELDTAEVNVLSAQAQIRSSQAALTQARSQLNTAVVNRAHTVIASPIDGIVISRNVEPGQTVNAGMSAPTLFVLAADLTKMQVDANIDEADVGKMRPGQPVTFRVDAYPADVFTGEVQQVRLNPTTVQNVVTYQTVIHASNTALKLKPGMTANAVIEVVRRSDVLRVPAPAIRFNPTPAIFAALNEPVPAGFGKPARATANSGTGLSDAVPAVRRATPPSVQAASSTRVGRIAGVPSIAGNATSVDSLFGPLATTETRGTAWIYRDKKLESVALRLGVSDGTWTEVLNTEALGAEADLVTAVITVQAAAKAAPSATNGNPLLGPQRGRPGGPGGR